MFVLMFVCWCSNCCYWSGFTPCILPLLLYALYWFQCQHIYGYWLKLFVMLIDSLTNVYFVSCDPTLAWWYIEAETKIAAILPMIFNSFSRVKCLQLFIYHIFPVVELSVLGSNYALVPNRWQAIICINCVVFQWRVTRLHYFMHKCILLLGHMQE